MSRKWKLSGMVYAQVIRENKQHDEDDSSRSRSCAALTFLLELSPFDPTVSVAEVREKDEQKDTVSE